MLRQIADAHNVTVRQVALRFVLRGPLLFTIPKASNPEHAAGNANASNLRLTEAEVALIDDAFPPCPRSCRLPVL